jgi:hypothetical protein
MDTTTLAQTLTCAEALEWLQGTLNDPDNEDLDPDEAMSAILESDWKSEEEFLEFFKEISIELAKTASESPDCDTARLFDKELISALTLWSPYYKLWEKAFETKSPALQEDIDIQEWETDISPAVETIKLINMIPLAMAFEFQIAEALRNRTIEGHHQLKKNSLPGMPFRYTLELTMVSYQLKSSTSPHPKSWQKYSRTGACTKTSGIQLQSKWRWTTNTPMAISRC